MSDVSEEFLSALDTGGQPIQRCCCGITHYATLDPDQIDEEDIEFILRKSVKRPNLYIEHSDCHCIYFATFRGVNYVVDCSCGKLARLERILWDSREMLMKYYKLRMDKMDKEQFYHKGLMADLLKGE